MALLHFQTRYHMLKYLNNAEQMKMKKQTNVSNGTMLDKHSFTQYNIYKYSSVFRENRCPPPPKPVYDGNFSHEAVTLKIRSRSTKSNKLFSLSDLYRLAKLVTFHPMVHEITCRQTLFGLILVSGSDLEN